MTEAESSKLKPGVTYPRYRQPKVGESVQYTHHDGTLRAALIMDVVVLGPNVKSPGVELTPILTLGVLQPPNRNGGGLWVEYVEQVPHSPRPDVPFSWRYTEEGVVSL